MFRIAVIGDEASVSLHTDACQRAAGIETAAALVANRGAEQGAGGWESSLATLLQRPDIEAVDVCTALEIRAEIAIRAAQAGKQLLVQQPVAASTADLDRLVTTCRQSGASLSTLQAPRHQPEAAALKAVVGAEELGPLCVAHLTSIRGWTAAERQAWRTAAARPGLFLAEQALELLDVAAWLFDSPVTQVFARGCTVEESGDNPQFANILLRFASGAQLVLDIGRTGSLAADAGLRSYAYIGRGGSVASDPRGGNLLYGSNGVLRLPDDPLEGIAAALRLWQLDVAAGRAGDPAVAARGVHLTLAIAASIESGAPVTLGAEDG